MDSDGQTSQNLNSSVPQTPVFHSSNIDKSKAGQKTNYFVNLKHSTAFDRLSQKIDQQKYYNELEAKKRAEAAAAEREKRAMSESVDRFAQREAEVKIPSFIKDRLTNGVAEPTSEKPVLADQPPVVAPKMETNPEPNPGSKKSSSKVLYSVLTGLVALIALGIIIWQLIPQEIVVSKQTSVPNPSEEKTLLDEITDRRLEILEIFETSGADAGIAKYNEYISEVSDSETLALIYTWEALDLYNLYRDEYKTIIKNNLSLAEELKPTEGTASLLYLYEHEFGNADEAAKYRQLALERQVEK